MSEVLKSKKIDINQDSSIALQELERAVKDGFFDALQPHEVDRLKGDLQQIDSLLEESFCRSLTQAYLEANKRIGTRESVLVAISPHDQAILDLYHLLSDAASWKYRMYQQVEQTKRTEPAYQERREGEKYSLQRLQSKKREFMAHRIFKEGTHEQKATLLRQEIDAIDTLKDISPTQKSERIKNLLDALMFTPEGQLSIFALKDRALGMRNKNFEYMQQYKKNITDSLERTRKLYESMGQSNAFAEYADPYTFLLKKQLHYTQLAQTYLDKMLALPDNEQGGSFASGWKTLCWEEFVPFLGQANSWYASSTADKLAELYRDEHTDAIQAEGVYDGLTTGGQEMFLQAYQGLQSLEHFDYGSRHTIGKGVGNAIPFLGEMFYLGPIFRQIGFTTADIAVAKTAHKVAMHATNITARGGVAATLDAPRMANMTSQRMLDGFQAHFDEQGNIVFEHITEGEGLQEAMAKAFGSLWVEMSVEHGLYTVIQGAKYAGYAGAEKLMGKKISPEIIAEGLMSRWLKRFAHEFPAAQSAQQLWKSITNKYGTAWVRKQFQWNGVLTEYIEEEVSGRGSNMVTADRGNRNPFYLSTQREVFETFMTTLIVAGGMNTMAVAASPQEKSSDVTGNADVYFTGKESRWGFTQQEALENNNLREQPNGHQLVKEKITTYAHQLEIDPALSLTDVQVDAIYQAHLLPGELAELSLTELLAKVRVLMEAFQGHPRQQDLVRMVLEGGFCGVGKNLAAPMLGLYEKIARASKESVARIKNRKERMTPMSAVISLCIFIVANSLDKAKREVLHKMVDLGQKMSETFEVQAEQIEAMGSDFESKMRLSKDEYDAMVANYVEFLKLAKEYNDTRVGDLMNWLTDDNIEKVIAAAESGQMTLLEGQQMTDQMTMFLQDMQQRTEASLRVAQLFERTMDKGHVLLDQFFNIVQWISAIALARSIWRAWGLYQNKSPEEQKRMMKYVKASLVGGVAVLVGYYAKVDPMIQARAVEMGEKIDEVIRLLETAEGK